MKQSNLHMGWARLLMSSFADAGVRDVVISPGSRSTPLVLAASAESRFRCHSIIDERSASFFALGQSRESGRPSMLLCTSGTAGAHYFPAVIEASLANVPLIVVTADRPWEAYDCAAPQTIDQTKLFGSHVRHFAEIGTPEAISEAFLSVQRTAVRATHDAQWPVAGPVHINVRFRKPLEPVDAAGEEWESKVAELIQRGAPVVHSLQSGVDPRSIELIAAACSRAKRGLIVCGPRAPTGGFREIRASIEKLSELTQFPVLAETTSQIRHGAQSSRSCASFDSLLRDPAFRRAHQPDLILEFGSPPTSGTYARYLGELESVTRFVIAAHGFGDPVGGATGFMRCDPHEFATRLCDERSMAREPKSAEWAESWTAADRRVWGWIDASLKSRNDLLEGSIARAVIDTLPDGGSIFVGNSTPVRDIDTYVPGREDDIRVFHQRGANGIDGIVSGSAGIASLSEGPVVALLGDVSALHDIGGLHAARAVKNPLVIVIVQNDGGRIFEQLPIKQRTELGDVFETHFLTKPNVSFEQASAAFGVGYHCVKSVSQLTDALRDSCRRNGCTVVEAIVDPSSSSAHRNELWRSIGAIIQGAP